LRKEENPNSKFWVKLGAYLKIEISPSDISPGFNQNQFLVAEGL